MFFACFFRSQISPPWSPMPRFMVAPQPLPPARPCQRARCVEPTGSLQNRNQQAIHWNKMEYPLVIKIAMDNHHLFCFIIRKSTKSMAIFHSYVKLPEGKFTVSHWTGSIGRIPESTSHSNFESTITGKWRNMGVRRRCSIKSSQSVSAQWTPGESRKHIALLNRHCINMLLSHPPKLPVPPASSNVNPWNPVRTFSCVS